MIAPADLYNLTSRDAVENFFAEELDYQVNPVPFDAAELGIPDAPAKFICETEQLCNYEQAFQVYFMDVTTLRRTDMRSILEPFYRKHPAGNYLFTFTKDYSEFAFVSPIRVFTGDDISKTRLHLRTLLVDRSNVYHTDLETLEQIRLLPGEANASVIWEKHREAFNVERVTKDFFKRYSEVFSDVERSIEGIPDANVRHLFTQTLFNRLMFCWFLQKKRWLNHEQDYFIRRLGDAKAQNKNFYSDVLYWLFFRGMNTPDGCRWPEEERRKLQPLLEPLIGEVPFLNGGLFEMNKDGWDAQGKIQIPNSAFDNIFSHLFGRYNFTVEESTHLDVRVAVDPEMLGKVFEELVIERHEKGSYYTPRNIVSFMCRESLKAYLNQKLPGKDDAIAALVDNHRVSDLSISDAKRIVAALDEVRVCDHACGSGAYLVGMLHELVELFRLIYNPQFQLEPRSLYEHKLDIIQKNLYGVDIDPFAVNVAMLRMWLSLAVDHEVDEISEVQPLPNLDFKIKVGDSLTAPNPEEMPDLFRHRSMIAARELEQIKAEFLRETSHRKMELKNRVEAKEQEMTKFLSYATAPPDACDWRVAFAEVFAEQQAPSLTLDGAMADLISTVPGQMEIATSRATDGFDIVLTNPPYLRQEVIKRQFGDEYKQNLTRLYPEAYVKTADIYVAFYARSHQLLRQNGVGCFISSNKWLRAGYGEKLRQHLLDKQAFRLVVDFGELPVFSAATFPAIFLWQKQSRGDTPTIWAAVKDLNACYDEGVREHVSRIAESIPASQFGKGKPRLTSPGAAGRRRKMEASGLPLGERIKGQMFYGIKTGLNQAFIIDRATRDRLIAEDPKSAEIIKPLLMGDDVRRYELHFRERYLIWTYVGVPIRQYPAIRKYLQQFQMKAQKRWDQGNYWWELRPCNYYNVFDGPKIIYPEIAKEPRFALDLEEFYPIKTIFSIPSDDWYLLGVLNSAPAFEYLQGICSVLGDEKKGGRLILQAIYMETLPVPDASKEEQDVIAELAREAQQLHTERRKRVEQFLRDIGSSPAQSSSRNPLEEPWRLTPEEFIRRAPKGTTDMKLFTHVRDETMALTERIADVEREIDERVAGLYGVSLDSTVSYIL